MFEYAAPTYDAAVAITIALPSSASPAKLSSIIAAGTVLTPSADLPSLVNFPSATIDNLLVTGSSPLTRYFAKRAARVIIENHPSSFITDWSTAMGLAVTRASGTVYVTPAARNGVRRVYASSATTSPITCTAILLLSLNEVFDLP